MVHEVKDFEDYHKQLKDAGDKLVVLDFTAKWCGPCQLIGPIFVAMADEFKDVVFLKVDVDDARDVSELCEISAMPTFVFYKSNQEVHRFSGATKDKLRAKVQELK